VTDASQSSMPLPPPINPVPISPVSTNPLPVYPVSTSAVPIPPSLQPSNAFAPNAIPSPPIPFVKTAEGLLQQLHNIYNTDPSRYLEVISHPATKMAILQSIQQLTTSIINESQSDNALLAKLHPNTPGMKEVDNRLAQLNDLIKMMHEA